MPLIGKRASHLLAGLVLALPGWIGWYDGADARSLDAPSVFASDITAHKSVHSVLGIDHSFPIVSGNRSAVALFGNLGSRVSGSSYGGHDTGSGLPDIHSGRHDLVVDTKKIGVAAELRQKMQHKMEGLVSPEGVARVAQSMQGQGRDTKDVVADFGAELAQAAIDSGLQRVEDELCCNGIVRGLNLSWSPSYGDRANLLQADAVFVALDSERAAVMAQLGLQTRDEETAGNIGVAMRTRITPDLLLGVNVFYDYLSEPRLDRWSVGAEVRHRWVTISSNYYTAITDPRRSGNEELYSPDGWDVELSGQVPGAPWFGYAARYYKWDRLGGKDLTGAEYTLAMKPMSVLTLKAKYDIPESGKDDLGFEVELRYNFDQTLAKQLSYQGVVPAEDVWRQRFERVRREYEQRVQRRQAGPGDALTQVACTTSTSGTVCIRINTVPQNAVAVIVRQVAGVTSGGVAAVGSNRLLRIVPDNCTMTQVVDASGCRLQTPIAGDVLTITGLAPGASFSFEFSYVDSGDMALTEPTVSAVAEGMLTQLGVVASASRVDETTGGTATVTLTISVTPGRALAAAFTLTGGTAGTNYSLTLADGTVVTSPVSISAPASEGAVSTLQLTITALDDADTVNENLVFTLTVPTDGSYSISPTEGSASVQINDNDDVASSDTTLSALSLTPSVALSPSFNQAVRSYIATVASNVASVQVAAIAADFRAMGITVLDGGNNSVGLNAAIALAVGTTTTITVQVMAEDASTGNYTIVVSRAAMTLPDINFTQTQPGAAVPEDTAPQQTVQLSISPGSHTGFTLRLQASGTATLTDDYTVTGLVGTAPNYTITINAGQTSASFSIAPTADDIDEENETVILTIQADGSYASSTTTAFTLTIDDNDTRGLAFSPAIVDVIEAATASYMVRLQSQPTATVTVTPSSPDIGAVTVAGVLTFTTANWASNQLVTVVGVDDVDTDNESVAIAHAISGGDYGTITAPSLTVRVDDNDDAVSTDASLSNLVLQSQVGAVLPISPAFQATTTNYMTTSDVASDAASVTVVATATAPSAAVVISLRSVVASNGVVSNLQTGANSIEIQVTAEDGATAVLYIISVTRAVAAATPAVSFAQAGTMAAEDAGIQQLQITISPGSHTGFTLRLQASGTATLTDDYTVTGLGGSAPNYTLNIAANESTASVSVTPSDDNSDENDETVIFEVVPDSAYSLGTISSATLTIQDNDTRGVSVSSANVDVTEGASTSYMLTLQTVPTSDVVITPISNNINAVTVGSALTFTSTNWNTPQEVTVSGVDDANTDNEQVTISHSISGADYGAVSVPMVTVRVDDDDDSLSTDSALSSLVLRLPDNTIVSLDQAFAAATTSYNATVDSGTSSVNVVAGSSVPSASVAISLTGAGATNGMVNNLQTGSNQINILVTAEDGTSTTTYTLTVVVLPDVNFAGIGATTLTVAEDAGRLSVTVSTTAADHAAITVSIMLAGSATLNDDYSIGGLSLDSGSIYTVTIAANQPGQDFTIDIMDDNDSEETENIILSVVDNDAYTVGATSTYTINITDNDTIGLVLTPTRLDVNEGGSGSYTIALASRPTATVMVTPASGDAAIATVAAATGSFPLMFTTANWQTPQTANVAGIEDADSVNGLVTIRHTVTGGNYDGLGAGSVIVRVADDEAAASPDATLASLAVTQAADSTAVTLSPVFSAAVTAYTATVPFASDGINIMAETNVPSASLVVSLNAVMATDGVVSNLVAGVENAVMVVVTAQDGSSQTYTVTVTRVAASTDNNLQSLTLSSGTLNPLFSAAEREYAASVGATVGSITVTAVAAASSASITMEVDSTALTVTDGVSSAILLQVNVPRRITVRVTAESGAQVDYLVTATRMMAAILPTISFASTGATVGEADAARQVMLSVTPATHPELIVSIELTGTATIGSDFSQNGLTDAGGGMYMLTIDPNSGGASFSLDPADDDTDDDGESAVLTIQSGGSYQVGANSAYAFNITDNDTRGVTVSTTTLVVAAAGTGGYTIALTSQPTVDVMVMPVSGDTDAATVAAAAGTLPLMFSTTNWFTTQGITVSGVAAGTSTISHTITTTGDYTGVVVGNVVVTVSDTAAETDTTLRVLSVALGDNTAVAIAPLFVAQTRTGYVATVANGVDAVTITATPAQTGATVSSISLRGTAATAGMVENLQVGDNTVSIVVAASDGINTDSYTINIVRSEALPELSVQAVAGTTIAEGETAAIRLEVSPPTDIAAMFGIASDDGGGEQDYMLLSNAVDITTAGTVAITAAIGFVELTVAALQDGDNNDETITFSIMANAGVYTISPTQGSVALVVNDDEDAALQTLTISPGTINETFAAATTAYTASVNVDTVTVTATPVTGAVAVISLRSVTAINGVVTNLQVGSNPLTIDVSAADGSTRQYTLDLTRGQSSDTSLSALAIAPGAATLTPTFGDNQVGPYIAMVGNDVTSITVTATATSPQASVATSLRNVPAPGGVVENLQVAANQIVVTVTAENGATAEYMIAVTRAAATAVPAIGISVANAAIPEGGMTTLTLRSSVAPAPGSSLPVAFTISGVQDADYSLTFAGAVVTSPLTLPAGMTELELILTAMEDVDTEAMETFAFAIDDGSGYTVDSAAASASVTIFAAPELSVATAAANLAEGESVDITITATPAPLAAIQVSFTITGTDITGADYSLSLAGTALDAGATVLQVAAASTVLSLTAVDDSDGDEQLQFTIVDGSGYSLGSPPSVAIGIQQLLPELSVEVSAPSVVEGGMVTISLLASPAPAAGISIAFTIGGSDIDAGDYSLVIAGGTTATSPVAFPATSGRLELTLTANDDADTMTEALEFTLTNPTNPGTSGYRLASSNISTTINLVPLAATPVVAVIADRDRVMEGESVNLTITSVPPPIGDLTVTFSVAGTDITTADYTLTVGGSEVTGSTVTVPISGSLVVNLAVANDADGEETLTFSLQDQDDYDISTGTSSVMVVIEPLVEISTDANLGSLSLLGATVDQVFDPDTTAYTASVGNVVSMSTLTVSTANDAASLVVAATSEGTVVTGTNGNYQITLVVGMNTLTITVTAEDGTTTKAYTLTIIRAASNNANLASLSLSAGTLSPTFSSTANSYTASVGGAVSQLTVTPTVSQAAATVQVNGQTVNSGQASTAINLDFGATTVTVVVTAEDTTTTETYTIVVTRSQPVVGVSFAAAAQVEGQTINATIDIAPAVPTPTTVSYVIAAATGGGAITAADYSIALAAGQTGAAVDTTANTVTIAANQSQVVLVFSLVDDADGPERLAMTIQDAAAYNVNVGSASAELTINPVQRASVSASAASIAEGGMVVFTVSLTPPPPQAIAVGYSIVGIQVSDITPAALSGEVMVATSGSGQLTLTAVDDADVTAETISFSLVEGDSYDLGTATNAMVMINPVSQITIAPTSATVAEGGEVTLTLTANPAPTMQTNVGYAISGANITTADYSLTGASGGIVVFPTGASSRTVTIMAADDADAAETLLFMLNAGTGYVLGSDRQSSVEITPIERIASVTVSPASTVEGGNVVLTINVNPPPGSGGIIVVNFAVSGNGITTGDYNLPGATSTTGLTGMAEVGSSGTLLLTLETVSDADNIQEMLVFAITSGNGYTVSAIQDSATIAINPVAQLSVSASANTVLEGEDVSLTLTLNPAPAVMASVNFAIGGRAITATDFNLSSDGSGNLVVNGLTGTVVIGTTGTHVITLAAVEDSDSTETLTFTLNLGAGYEVSPTAASVDITINPISEVSISPASSTIVEGAIATLTVRASPAPVAPLTVSYSISGDSITTGDYSITAATNIDTTANTVTIPIAGSQVIAIMANDDADGRETLRFAISAGAGYSLSTSNIAAINIVPRSVVSVQAAPVRISETGRSTLTITATPAPPTPIMVGFSITGVAVSDFSLGGANIVQNNGLSGVVMVPASGTAEIILTAADDADVTTENLQFTLQPGSNHAVAVAPGNSASVMIEPISIVSVVASPGTVTEGDVSTITITATPPPSRELTVNYQISGGVVAGDYMLAGTGLVPDGANSRGTVTIPTSGTRELTLTTVDDADNNTEQFVFTIPAAAGYQAPIAGNRATVNIEAMIVIPQVSISSNPVLITEGQSSIVTISLTPAVVTPLTVRLMVAGANITRSDFTLTGGSGLSFPGGSATGTISLVGASSTFSITAVDDADTMDEVITINIMDATDGSYTVGIRAAQVTVRPIPQVTVAASAISLVAGDSGTSTLTITVAPATATTVSFSIAGVTRSDFTLTGAGLNLPAGQSVGTVAVPGSGTVALTLAANRDSDSATETMVFRIEAGAGYGVGGNPSASIQIAPLVVSLSSTPLAITPEATGNGDVATLDISVDNSTSLRQALPVRFSISGAGINATDYSIAGGGVTGSNGNFTVNIPTSGMVELSLTATADADNNVENLTVTLTRIAASQYTINPVATSANIAINPIPRLSVSASPSTITEEDAGTTFSINSNVNIATAVTVGYVITGNNITAADFTLTALAGTTIAANQLRGTITIAPRTAGPVAMLRLTASDDSDGAEMLTFTINDGVGYTVGTASTTVAINPAPEISVRASAATIAEGGAAVTITASSNVSLGTPLTVNYTISGVMAADFSLTGTASPATNRLSGTLIIPAGTAGTSRTLTLMALADADTGNETLRFTVGTGSGYTVSGSNGAVNIAITQAVPEISVTAGAMAITEGGAAVTLTVRSNIALSSPLTVNYAINGVAATDFRLTGTASQSGLGGTVTIAMGAGTPSVVVMVAALVDADTNNETLRFVLGTGGGYTVSGSNGAANIVINQPVPAISVRTSAATITEGGTAVTITASSNVSLGSPLTVNYTISGVMAADFSLTGTASQAPNRLSGTLIIPAGTAGTSRALTLMALVDADTGNETLRFVLGTGAGYTVSGTGTVDITIDQPAPVPAISVSTSAIAIVEGGAAVTITASSNIALGSQLTVNYTIGGSVSTDDFSLTGTASQAPNKFSGTLIIPIGNAGTSRTLTLMALADADTGNETLRFVLGTGDGYTVSGTGTVDITIDQPAPVPAISVSTSATSIAEGGANVVLTIQSNAFLANPLTVNYTISGVTADDFSLTGTASQATNRLSGTLTIPAGNAGTSRALTLMALADADTDNETLRFVLGTGDGYTVSATGTVNITIENQAARVPELSVSATSDNVAEGATVTMTVRPNIALTEALTVNYTVSGVTADDFSLTGFASQVADRLSGTLTIPAGNTRTLTLTALEDADTNNETLRFTIAMGDGYTVSSTTGAVDIVISQPTITPPDTGMPTTIVSIAALRTAVGMGVAAAISFRVGTTNGWQCVEGVRYVISTNATSTDLSGLRLSGAGIDPDAGLQGTIPCGVIFRNGATAGTNTGPDISCGANCPFSSSRNISLVTNTRQSHFSSTVTIRLLPSTQNGGYQLLSGGESTTVTVQNRGYRPYTTMSVGTADSGISNFARIEAGAATSINHRFVFIDQGEANTNIGSVPLMFRISGTAPVGSFTLTEAGSGTPITVRPDNTFTVTVPAGVGAATRSINVTAATNLADTYRMFVELVEGRTEYEPYLFTRGGIELATPDVNGLPVLNATVNNRNISPMHTDVNLRTAIITISSNRMVESPITINYSLASIGVLWSGSYSLSHNGSLFHGYEGPNSDRVFNRTLTLAGGRDNWQIILTPIRNWRGNQSNFTMLFYPGAGYQLREDNLINPSDDSNLLDVTLNDLFDVFTRPSDFTPTPPSSDSRPYVVINYGRPIGAGQTYTGAIRTALKDAATADIAIDIDIAFTGIAASDVTISGFSGTGNRRTITLPRGSVSVPFTVTAGSSISSGGFVAISIVPSDRYGIYFGGRCGINITSMIGTSILSVSANPSSDTPIVGGVSSSMATLTISSTSPVPPGTQLYYAVRTRTALHAFDLRYNGAVATSPITISGAGPWQLTVTAPRSFSGLTENLNFSLEPGIGYDISLSSSDADVNIAQCARHLCPP